MSGRKAKRPAKAARFVLPEGLREVIEAERERLRKAHALLHCTTVAMEVDDGPDDGPYYPVLVELARDMVDEAIQGLDSVNLIRAAQAGGKS